MSLSLLSRGVQGCPVSGCPAAFCTLPLRFRWPEDRLLSRATLLLSPACVFPRLHVPVDGAGKLLRRCTQPHDLPQKLIEGKERSPSHVGAKKPLSWVRPANRQGKRLPHFPRGKPTADALREVIRQEKFCSLLVSDLKRHRRHHHPNRTYRLEQIPVSWAHRVAETSNMFSVLQACRRV